GAAEKARHHAARPERTARGAALSVIGSELLEDAGDTPASTDFRSNLELRRLAQASLQKFSDGPEIGGSAFAAAIYGVTRKIILLREWSKNLPIDQHRSGKRREW